MPMKTFLRARFLLPIVAAAGLAATQATPAHAEVPPVNTTFKITTVYNWKRLCATFPRTDNIGGIPLVPCREGDPNQLWKLTAPSVSHPKFQAPVIKNVGSNLCLLEQTYFQHRCAQMNPWQQSADGSVWRQGENSITKIFWNTYEHKEGPRIYFPQRENGTTPEELPPFRFDEVKR